MDNKNDTSIDVECPHCFKENKINLSTEIKCKHCEKSLIGHKYRKPFMSAMTALIIGAGGTYYINEQFESNRYPINIEYAIINSCVSYSDRPLLRKDYRNKENICICALKKVQKEIDYSDYKKEKSIFLNTFDIKTRACM